MMDMDEHPKPQTTLEQMAKLPTVFKKGGVVTAASASGICDGAAAVIGNNTLNRLHIISLNGNNYSLLFFFVMVIEEYGSYYKFR